jgi:ABC-type bacteriocin/lantibiotic exporter with double-glycine peptidase domain
MDPALDAAIVQMLAELTMTRIVVTHRSTPLHHADRVLELAAGRLRTKPTAAEGRHLQGELQ